MATKQYAIATVYGTQAYTGVALLGFPTLYLAGASLAAPTGSNLPAPAPVGRYGAFNASGTTTETKALPMRFGKNLAFVSFAGIGKFGQGNLVQPTSNLGATVMPAYGN